MYLLIMLPDAKDSSELFNLPLVRRITFRDNPDKHGREAVITYSNGDTETVFGYAARKLETFYEQNKGTMTP